MMKKKLALFLVAAVAVALCAISLAACGPSADIGRLYERVFETGRADGVAVAAKELDFDDAEYEVLDGAVVFTEINGGDTVRHLMIDGNVVYSGGGEIGSIDYGGIGWLWSVKETSPDKLAFYTSDGAVKTYDEDLTYTCVSSTVVSMSNGDTIWYDPRSEKVTVEAAADSPSLDPDLDLIYRGEDVTIYGEQDTYLVEDKDGERLCFVDLREVVPEGNDSAPSVIFLTEKGALMQKLIPVADDAKEYDYYMLTLSKKYIVKHYFYEWRSGKVVAKRLDAVFAEPKEAIVLGDEGAFASVFIKRKDKELSPSGLYVAQFFDKNFNISVDVQELFPGINVDDLTVWGDYLVVDRGSIIGVYDADGKLVTEFVEDRSREMNVSGMFVKGNDWFTISGEYVFTLDGEGKQLIGCVPGKVYFKEYELDETNSIVVDEDGYIVGEVKVYDVATGAMSVVCDAKDYYGNIDETVYFVTDGSGDYSVYSFYDGAKLVEFTADRVEIEEVGEDKLISYNVTGRNGTTQQRYIYINVDVVPAA